MKFLYILPLIALAAQAQTRLSLKEAVSQALSTHPLIPAGTQRVAVNEGLRRQAGLYPNPQLVLQQENVQPYGNPPFQYWRDTDSFAFLQQTFETAGKRQKRADAASLDVRQAELELELTRRRIAARVSQAYWAALGARSIHDLLVENSRNFQRIIEYHEIRVREGAMAEVDLIRVRLEGERFAIAANSAHLDAERARILLLQEMGQARFPEVDFVERLDHVDERPAVPDIEEGVRQRVEMQIARLNMEQAEAKARLERAQARPDLNVVFGYKRSAGLDTMVGGLQFDLPLWNRNQGNIASADSGTRFAQSSLAATEALVRAEIDTAMKNYQIRREAVIHRLRPMMEQARESSEIAEAAYREGGADLLRLLDAQRTRIEAQVIYFQILSEFHQSVAAFEAALGVMP